MSIPPKLLTPDEAGEVIGVSGDTIRRWVSDGYTRADGSRARLRGVDVGSPKYPRLRIREDDLADLIEARTYAPSPQAPGGAEGVARLTAHSASPGHQSGSEEEQRR